MWACVSGWLIAPRYNGPDSPSSTPRHSSRPLIPLTAPPRRGTGTPKNIQWAATKHTITLDVPFYYAPASILSVFISLWVFLTLLPSSRVIFFPFFTSLYFSDLPISPHPCKWAMPSNAERAWEYGLKWEWKILFVCLHFSALLCSDRQHASSECWLQMEKTRGQTTRAAQAFSSTAFSNGAVSASLQECTVYVATGRKAEEEVNDR